MQNYDWYDLVWFVSRQIPLHLKHLEKRMQQSGHLDREKTLTSALFKNLLNKKIDSVAFDQVKADVAPFVKDPQSLTVWSKEFFKELTERISFV